MRPAHAVFPAPRAGAGAISSTLAESFADLAATARTTIDSDRKRSC
ncbi:hypothetical protein [Streptomyces chryseus]|nr:hypothetical protein [Streptomyces chryseus]